MSVSLANIRYVYLLGIGGIGMSALARYFKAAGRRVCGYDKTPTELTGELQAEGIDVHFTDDTELLPDFLSGNGVNPEVLIIYTPAIPKDHSQKNAIAARGYQLYKRSQVLGMLTRTSKTVAVAGTHGKTTTSTMIAHILKSSGVDCTAFLGGISRNYNTNLLLGSGNPETEWIVVEADEYDRSFLTLHPKVAVVTSLDADHLDIYGNRESMIESYSQFASQTDPDGRLIKRAGLELGNVKAASWTYGIDSGSDFAAADVRVEQSAYVFDVYAGREHLGQFRMNWPGRHNVENALGAIAACTAAGVDPVQIKNALERFTGVKRRFDYRVKSDETVYIDDYAHHPEELRATIESVKELYPGKRIMGIFQPHLYTRTRDFADGFGTSLSLLDEVLLMDIYPARELPIPGVTSGMILEKITAANKSLCSREEIVSRVTSTDAPVILTLGAGDIDQLVEPITRALTTKFNVQPA